MKGEVEVDAIVASGNVGKFLISDWMLLQSTSSNKHTAYITQHGGCAS